MGQIGRKKKLKNSKIMYKLDIKELIQDINLTLEALNNKDYKDAIALLEDILSDLIIIEVLSCENNNLDESK